MVFLLILILLALLFPSLMRLLTTLIGFAFLFLVVAVVAHAGTDLRSKDLIQAEDLLDDVCRGSDNPDSEVAQLASDARDTLYKALYKGGWWFGKNDQPESEKRWHKCGKTPETSSQVSCPNLRARPKFGSEGELLSVPRELDKAPSIRQNSVDNALITWEPSLE